MLVDSFIIIMLIGFSILGYRKGVVSEFISFSALLFNIVLSKETTPYIAKKINFSSENEMYTIFIYLGIFIFTYIVFAIIIAFMLRTIKDRKKMIIDKITASLLGLAKALLISVIAFLVLDFISKFDKEVDKKLEKSKLYKEYDEYSESIMIFLPEEIKQIVYKKEYEKEVGEAIRKSLGGKK